MRIVNVVGARPNFIKIAPLMDAYRAHAAGAIEPLLVHTGQHYDQRMSELFFTQLGIPRPDINMGIGSGTHAQQTAAVMTAFEQVCVEHKPHAVLVVGDVNSTLACSLVAVKLGIKVVHVEAGLRSNDRTMPEEINRLCTDAISDLLFVTEQSGVDHLRREGVDDAKIHLVGNVMIDTLLKSRAAAESSTILADLKVEPRKFALLTLHRPSNVDDPAALSRLLDALDGVQRRMPLIFPIHPRTRSRISDGPLASRVAGMANLRMIEPAGYLDFVKLMSAARLVLTDSGGVQEETTVLRVPCLTLRQNTERPVTCTHGSNRLVGTDPAAITAAFEAVMASDAVPGGIPPLWDGRAAERIVSVLRRTLG
jgi:UDP-N-acetylglucosamine 2-epimerase (non-hydrolysing)